MPLYSISFCLYCHCDFGSSRCTRGVHSYNVVDGITVKSVFNPAKKGEDQTSVVIAPNHTSVYYLSSAFIHHEHSQIALITT